MFIPWIQEHLHLPGHQPLQLHQLLPCIRTLPGYREYLDYQWVLVLLGLQEDLVHQQGPRMKR